MHALIADPPPAESSQLADMEEDERRSESPGRREADSELVRHVRATDAGVSLLWRWANILTTVVCCGFVAGVFYAKSSSMEKSIVELSIKMERVSDAAALTDKEQALMKQQLAMIQRDNDKLEKDVRELRGDLSTMRDMREAYVYSSSGKAAPGKSPGTVPP